MWVTPAAGSTWDPLFRQEEERYDFPPGLLSRVAYQESRYRPDAYNASSGASGMMQLVPQYFPGVDPFDPAQAIPAAARYLDELWTRYYLASGGELWGRELWTLALAAYNAGPGAVDEYGGVPPYPETQAFVAEILGDVFGPPGASSAAPLLLTAAGAAALYFLTRGK
jgi:soluble lytic murein transglycosylase-like protein